MENHFNLLLQTRKNILSTIEELSDSQLNKIPEGYSNNIAWNMGHVLVTQQLLCYKLSKLPMKYEEEIINKFRNGSKPEQAYTSSELSFIKKELIKVTETTKKDYELGIFNEYNTYTTGYRVELKSSEEAIAFNNLHEALHYGYILAQKKLV